MVAIDYSSDWAKACSCSFRTAFTASNRIRRFSTVLGQVRAIESGAKFFPSPFGFQ
jgi:hypothetical protein